MKHVFMNAGSAAKRDQTNRRNRTGVLKRGHRRKSPVKNTANTRARLVYDVHKRINKGSGVNEKEKEKEREDNVRRDN